MKEHKVTELVCVLVVTKLHTRRSGRCGGGYCDLALISVA